MRARMRRGDEIRLQQQALGFRLRLEFDDIVMAPVPPEWLEILRGKEAPEKPLQPPPGSDEGLIETEIVALLDKFHDGQRERKARDIMQEIVSPRLRSLLGERDEWKRSSGLNDEDAKNLAHHSNVLSARLQAAEASLLRVTEERDAYRKRNVEVAVLAYKWMDAHDLLKAGKPYAFPAPADLPDAIARAQAAEASLSALRGEVGKVLGPFAEVAGWYHESEPDTFEVWLDYPHGFISRKPAQLKHYRAAASLLSTLEGNDSIVSRASLPAHVSEATATDAPLSDGWRPIDSVTEALAEMLNGRLRRVSRGRLRKLKAELRNFNATTGEWNR